MTTPKKNIIQTIREKIQNRKSEPEKLDYTPVEIPEGFAEPENLEDMMRRMVREQLANYQQAREVDETPEYVNESLDLDDVDDEMGIFTEHTLIEMENEEGFITQEELMQAAADMVEEATPHDGQLDPQEPSSHAEQIEQSEQNNTQGVDNASLSS